jgi:hypothetical protein
VYALGAAALAAVVWAAVRLREAPPSPPPTTPVTPEDRARDRARERARGALQGVANRSHALMPPGFEALWLAMPVEDLRRLRPRASPAQGMDTHLEETTEEGARVVYLTAPPGIVTQVQFLSRLTSTEELLPHFQALRARYGEPTGFWDCPEAPDRSPVRRITWRREHASVMEAILVYAGRVSVTLVVAATGDVASALARSQCRPVTRQSLDAWPVAQELRGRQTPLTPTMR